MTDGVGREFLRRTRYEHLGPSDQQKGEPHPPMAADIGTVSSTIPLPPPDELHSGAVDFGALVTGRESLRRFAAVPFTLRELSFLLWCTQGVKRLEGPVTRRTVPSAGSRHPFETLLLVNRAEGLSPGLHAFDALGHRLHRLDAPAGTGDRICKACLGQSFLLECAVTFIWIAVPHRTTWRYGDRGYRYLHLDAGHVCQNLYLAAEAIGGGACAVAAFDDDALNRALGLDGDSLFAIYLAACGRSPEQKARG
jgi:SagB-type dehydrogenase family enzyme